MEQEVDRIIDSQDNEYVLSRPKCALRQVLESVGMAVVVCPTWYSRGLMLVQTGKFRHEAVPYLMCWGV